MSKPSRSLGATDGQLAPCPGKPNCVSSQSTDERHAISPLEYTIADELAWEKLHEVIDAMPRTKIIKADAAYLHCECRSALLKFVDDVEFCLDREHRTIQFRSASRLGYSDMGTNRKRMEQVRIDFSKATR